VIIRQRILLRLANTEGGTVKKLRLVKLAFLFQKEVKEIPPAASYEFLPYEYGPVSFTLYHELRGLERDGWIVQNEKAVELTEYARLHLPQLDEALARAVSDLSRRYRKSSTHDVVAGIYQKYPWYTLNSKEESRRAATRPDVPPAVYTVGYEGWTVDGFINLLLRRGMRCLIDVRANPVARRYGFHRQTLNRLCGNVGLAYIHAPALGVPSSWRQDLGDMASYERLFRRYDKEILPTNEDALATLRESIANTPSVLMCREADPRCCHRSRLALALGKATGLPILELRG